MVSEEQILEYLAKKAQKKAMKVAKKLKTATVPGYLNESNPFGDANLNEKFVWKKNKKRDVMVRGVSLEERIGELEKVKKRRIERVARKARWEEEMMLFQREQAKAEGDDFLRQELEFDFNQNRLRSKIRIREGRMKPIDVLTTYLDDELDVELDGRHYKMVFKGLTVSEIEELHDEIKLYLSFDKQTPTHIAYWEAMMVVCESELGEARRKNAMDRAGIRAEQRGLHSSIDTDVRNFLEGMSHDNLVELQSEIESDLRSGKAKVVEFWEAVLNGLPLYKAKACLTEIHHAKMLRRDLNRLEQKSLDFDNSQSEEYKTEDEIEHEIEDSRAFSPKAITDDETGEAIDSDVDKLVLEKHRLAVLKRKQRQIENSSDARATKVVEAVDGGDALLGPSAEVDLDYRVVWWHDRYRPRKPMYYNRVHTGYEWNKYNRIHFDHDNPPPKMVQGYKFEIFYPDLVDKQLAPTYVIEKDGDSTETCIIRFHAGPPYEDIAFRIVNKEWEYSRKKGYKCTFERGALHLYFNFIRYRYRR